MTTHLELESVLEKDFANALEKFGIQSKYVQEFRTREPELKGWDFGTVEPSLLEVQQKEADYFMRCIELEEQMEQENVDPVVKKQMKDDVKLYRAEMEVLKWERISRVEEIALQKQQQLSGISGIVLSITEEQLLASVTPENTEPSSNPNAQNSETPDTLNQNSNNVNSDEQAPVASVAQTTDIPTAPEHVLEQDWTII